MANPSIAFNIGKKETVNPNTGPYKKFLKKIKASYNVATLYSSPPLIASQASQSRHINSLSLENPMIISLKTKLTTSKNKLKQANQCLYSWAREESLK